jgi:hypothetical protein
MRYKNFETTAKANRRRNEWESNNKHSKRDKQNVRVIKPLKGLSVGFL